MRTTPDICTADLLLGTPFQAERRMGAGGMGEIYEARRRRAREKVVVKVLKPELVDQPGMVDRMRIEAQALALLSHPNIVAPRGHGFTRDGRPWVAMEYLAGPTLKEELAHRGALAPSEAVAAAEQILSALSEVHAAGIVHRDVKPENIIVVKRPGLGPVLKLLDFGVAKVERWRTPRLAPLCIPTADGAYIGTPRYASPEQVQGAQVDCRADLYAAGLILYAMLAGRGPFDEVKGIEQVLKAHLFEEVLPPSRFARTAIPRPIEEVVMTAVAKDPQARFADALTFQRALVRAASSCSLVSWDTRLDLMTTGILVRSGDFAIVRSESPGPTIAKPRFDLVSTVVVRPRAHHLAKCRPKDADRVRVPRVAAPDQDPPVSRVQVLVSAAAFATVAGGLAMWFVR